MLKSVQALKAASDRVKLLTTKVESTKRMLEHDRESFGWMYKSLDILKNFPISKDELEGAGGAGDIISRLNYSRSYVIGGYVLNEGLRSRIAALTEGSSASDVAEIVSQVNIILEMDAKKLDAEGLTKQADLKKAEEEHQVLEEKLALELNTLKNEGRDNEWALADTSYKLSLLNDRLKLMNDEMEKMDYKLGCEQRGLEFTNRKVGALIEDPTKPVSDKVLDYAKSVVISERQRTFEKDLKDRVGALTLKSSPLELAAIVEEVRTFFTAKVEKMAAETAAKQATYDIEFPKAEAERNELQTKLFDLKQAAGMKTDEEEKDASDESGKGGKGEDSESDTSSSSLSGSDDDSESDDE